MKDDSYWVDGESKTSQRLLRILLASAIIDSGGNLNISRKSLSELSDYCGDYRGFQILATPGDDHGMELTIEWLR